MARMQDMQDVQKAVARIGQLRLRDMLLLEQIQLHGSLRKVAEAMHVTQPAVTQALQVLERAFGVALVERGRRGVRLTEAGAAAAARLNAARGELSAAYAAAQKPHSPLLHIGASPMASLEVLPAGIARLHKSNPEMRVVITEASVPRLWQELAEGLLDGIVSSVPTRSQVDGLPEGITYHIVGSERLALVAPRAHPVAKRRPDIAVLAKQAWVLPPPGSLAMRMFDEWFGQGGIQVPEVAMTSVSFFVNLQLAARCGMLTLVPESAAKSHAALLDLKIIATPWEHKRGEIVLACRTSALDNPILKALHASFRAQEAFQT